VLTEDEARRFVPDGGGDPQADITVAWELLYRLEPELYDRLVSAERLHAGVLGWLPRNVERICKLTWMCVPRPVGPNIHANTTGYGVIAKTFKPLV